MSAVGTTYYRVPSLGCIEADGSPVKYSALVQHLKPEIFTRISVESLVANYKQLRAICQNNFNNNKNIEI